MLSHCVRAAGMQLGCQLGHELRILRPIGDVRFLERVGPFIVPGSGHFLQWERAEVLNQAMKWFCRDLVESRPSGVP